MNLIVSLFRYPRPSFFPSQLVMTAAIRVSNLGKRYRVQQPGQRATYRTLRESLGNLALAPLQKWTRRAERQADDFWALKGIDFEIPAGEVVGIIGHNGAGKSTLLKILSQITKPTTGRAELNGRIGSLLEVGTGFHPELTGRDNILLNGSILGMSRRDILSKFDEITEFAGINRFLDTPVKRYSSGMYVRLAFAVSVHLDSEILLIDEILAVGDADFQRRCFQKMESISRQGKTVLFVSHNLSIIRNLCTSAITLSAGQVIGRGPSHEQVGNYLNKLANNSKIQLSERTDREGDGRVRLQSIRIENQDRDPVTSVFPGDQIRFVIGYKGSRTDESPTVALSCFNAEGAKVFHVDNLSTNQLLEPLEVRGEYGCVIPRLPLTPGNYSFNAMIAVDGRIEDHVFSATSLEVLPGDFHQTGRTTPAHHSLVFLENSWESPSVRLTN